MSWRERRRTGRGSTWRCLTTTDRWRRNWTSYRATCPPYPQWRRASKTSRKYPLCNVNDIWLISINLRSFLEKKRRFNGSWLIRHIIFVIIRKVYIFSMPNFFCTKIILCWFMEHMARYFDFSLTKATFIVCVRKLSSRRAALKNFSNDSTRARKPWLLGKSRYRN